MAFKSILTNIPNTLKSNGTYIRERDQVYAGYRLGESVPGWRQLVAAKQDATSNMQLNAIRVVDARPLSFSHNWDYHWGVNPGESIPYVNQIDGYWYSSLSHAVSHAASVSSNDDAEALSRLYNKIRSESYGTNGLLILGELKETLQMIRRPGAALRDSVSTLLNTIRTTRAGVQRTLKPRRSETQIATELRRRNAVKNAVAGTILEAQFGWRPWISDTKEILEEAINLMGGGPIPRGKLTGRCDLRGGNHMQVDTFDTPVINQLLRHNVKRHIRSTAQVRWTCGMNSNLSGPLVEANYLYSRLGFSWQNVVPTIYNLLPWTFLIDYFVNVGDILEAVCTDVHKVTYCYKTTRTVSTVELCESIYAINIGSGQGSYTTRSLTGSTQSRREIEYVTVTREKVGALPLPSLSFSIPGETEPKWLNIAALLAQARDYDSVKTPLTRNFKTRI